MDHNNISNSVRSTVSFNVEWVENPDVPSCSGFWGCCENRPLRKLDKNILGLSVVIMCVPRKVYVFLYIRGDSVYSAAQFTVQLTQFPVSMERLKLRKQKLTELLTMNQHRAPWMVNDLAIHGAAHYVKNVSVQSSIFYWNASFSTPVFSSRTTIMCN